MHTHKTSVRLQAFFPRQYDEDVLLTGTQMSPGRIRGGTGERRKEWRRHGERGRWSLLVIKCDDSPNMTINHGRNQSVGRLLLHADNASINI